MLSQVRINISQGSSWGGIVRWILNCLPSVRGVGIRPTFSASNGKMFQLRKLETHI